MDKPELPSPIASLVDYLANLPHVIAITRRWPGRSSSEPADTWDLGLYHRGGFDPDDLVHLDGVPTAPADRGTKGNDWSTLLVDGLTVNIHCRDLDVVEHWTSEAREGRFQVKESPGHLAGTPTYTLAAEIASSQVLAGSLDLNVDYPDRLAEAGAVRWRYHAGTSLEQAGARAARGDLPGVAHHLARAYAEAAHARLCEAREWAHNEKENLERAELTHLNEILTALKTDPVTLTQRVMQARALLLD